MDNETVSRRYRQQAQARLTSAGLQLAANGECQFSDHGNLHVTRANIGMLVWSAVIDLASCLFIQERRTQPSGRSPLITRFITEDMSSITPGPDYPTLWRAATRLHTVQHATDTEPRVFAEYLIDASRTVETLVWLLEPQTRIASRSYGWLRRARTEYIPDRDIPLEKLIQMATLPDIARRSSTDGSYPLHWAAKNPDPEVAYEFLRMGAEIEARDTATQATPLREAARAGHPQAVETLLNHGAELGARDISNATPLHNAAGFNALDMVEILITRGADIQATDAMGETPLHWAARWQQDPAVTELLLQNGADPDHLNQSDQTPYQLAKQRSNLHAIVMEQTAVRRQ